MWKRDARCCDVRATVSIAVARGRARACSKRYGLKVQLGEAYPIYVDAECRCTGVWRAGCRGEEDHALGTDLFFFSAGRRGRRSVRQCLLDCGLRSPTVAAAQWAGRRMRKHAAVLHAWCPQCPRLRACASARTNTCSAMAHSVQYSMVFAVWGATSR